MTNQENKVLIITGGNIVDSFLSEHLTRENYSMIIAADHGLTVADRLGIKLDYIVGDFDSVSETIIKKYHSMSTPIKTFPTEKDKTDTEIAIELALMYNATAVDILGATGSRLDHVLANIHLLLLPLQLKINACIIDPNNKIYLKNESFTIEKNNQFGDYVSLLPYTEQVNGLSLKGFKYPLNNITLSTGTSLGISNEIREETAQVIFRKGILLVIESKD